MHASQHDAAFRFFDNREKYLLFATTCSEKKQTARRISAELERLMPKPPMMTMFQAGSGEGTLLNRVLRELHLRWPTVPLVAVVKENSAEFVRMAVRNLADRFREHPQLVLIFTNLPIGDTPTLGARVAGDGLNWRSVALTGTSSHGFDRQIIRELEFVDHGWPGGGYGNSVMVLYRQDHAFSMHRVIPEPGFGRFEFDLIVCSQAYRSRLPASIKVKWLLAPLAESLAPGGRMLVAQSTGRDPGMEIIHAVWPEENPFATPREILLEALEQRVGPSRSDLAFEDPPGGQSEYRFELQLNPEDIDSNIGTSTLLAAWNAATYVAQIDDSRVTEAMSGGRYMKATEEVLSKHKGLWFLNECFVVSRTPPE